MNTRWRIGFYFVPLLLFNGLGDPTGLLSLPILFILKDRLHLAPYPVALFEAITLLPYYLAFLFGVLRDRWRPFGLGDRGYFILAAPVAITCYAWVAAHPLTYGELLGAMLIAMAAYQALDVATAALITRVAQRHSMTGRLSALSESAETIVSVASMLAGGWMTTHCSFRSVFLIATAFTAGIFAMGFWRSTAVLSEEQAERPQAAEQGWRPFLQVLRHRDLWPAALILLLYNFSPGWGTPFFFYLTERVGLSSQGFAACRAVQYGSVLAAAAVYSLLCRRTSLERLLWWAVVLNAFPGFLFLIIGGAAQAVAVSAAVGLLAGFANIALFDLLMRVCPRDLEGTGTAVGHTTFGLAGVAGDLLGAWLYERGGFALCLALDAAATLLILGVLKRIPRRVVSLPEGEFASLAVEA